MDSFLNPIRKSVKKVMHQIAVALNALSGGKLTPNTVTIIGLLAHLPIAWLIFNGYHLLAGLWLIIFGLFDTLDGELARLQKRASPAGMFLDSVTDRMKEIMIYVGVIGFIATQANNAVCTGVAECFTGAGIGERFAFAVVIAVLGGSMLTSYINAWGEAVMGRAGIKSAAMNKAFRGGLGSFEIRMALLVLGLLTDYLFTAIIFIGLFVAITIIERMYKVFRELSRVQD